MDDFKPNSHRFKQEQDNNTERKKVEKVVSGTAKTKKKSEIHKFTDIFLAEDFSSVKDFIVSEILLPSAKKLVTDVVKDGIDTLIYGSPSYRDRGSNTFRAPYVSYGKMTDRRDERAYASRPRNGYNYDDVVLKNRGDAEVVLRQLDELMETYRVVRVADLYDLVGLQHNYTDNNYGWTNIRNAEIVRLRDGDYMIKMPRAIPLD
jgi:hypothetical protein